MSKPSLKVAKDPIHAAQILALEAAARAFVTELHRSRIDGWVFDLGLCMRMESEDGSASASQVIAVRIAHKDDVPEKGWAERLAAAANEVAS